MKVRFGIAAALVLLASLILAPTAGAELGITGYFKLSGFSPTGSAVNHTGAGGVSPGELYASAGNGGPVERFSPLGELDGEFAEGANEIAVNQATGDVYVTNFYGDGEAVNVYSATGVFLRRFGYNVVSSGPDNSAVNAQQRLRVIATGGTFTLSCCVSNSVTLRTKPIPYDASATAVEGALNELSGLSRIGDGGKATVTGGPGDAGGLHPYTITFGGPLAGNFVRALDAESSKLTGSFHSATINMVVPGGAAEVCTPPADVCGEGGDFFVAGANGSLANQTGIAIAPSGAPNAGDVLIGTSGDQRISEFTPAGQFVRAVGWDVVAQGPGDSLVNERQKVTLGATGGSFSLSFRGQTTGAEGNGDLAKGSTAVTNLSVASGTFAVGQIITSATSGAIPAGTTIASCAPSCAVATELTLSAAAATNTAGGALTANDLPFNASAAQVETALNGLSTIGGASGSVAVSGAAGGPYTIEFGGTLGGDELQALGSSATGLSGGTHSVAVGTIADGGALEACVQSAGDLCKRGVSGTRIGQFEELTAVAEDSSGAIYVIDSPPPSNQAASNYRLTKLVPSGSGFVASLFGTDEVQTVTVNASGGKFKLSFGAEDGGTTGHGDFTQGSTTITNVTTSKGEFGVGQPIDTAGGILLPKGTLITGIGPTTLTVSKPATGPSLGVALFSDRPYRTPDIDQEAPAAAVESALDGLPSIGGVGGSVTVTGPDGGPYQVTFDGGILHYAEVPPIVGSQGSPPLSGGVGPGANQALVAATAEGGPNGLPAFSIGNLPPELLNAPVDVAIDDADHVYVSRLFPIGDTTCRVDGSPSPGETRIQLFDTAGALQEASAPCYGIQTNERRANLTVDPIAGTPYLLAAVGGSSNSLPSVFGTGRFAFIFGDLGALPELTLNTPVEITPTGVTVSGTITPHGPAASASQPNPSSATYRLEYRRQGETEWTQYAPAAGIGTADTPQPFSIGVSGLTPKTDYELRITVSKLGFADVAGPIQMVTTAGAPPTVDTFSSSDVTASSADLRALVNPLGTDTTYHFEYGTTIAYGKSTPETDIGESQQAVAVLDHLQGLQPAVYHFRVVAHNSFGTTTTTGQTFNFYPEPCPNNAVRQQTGAGGLPDCRAYELASPADAGTAVLVSGGPNSAYASSPSRLSFMGALGTIPGAGNPPNVLASLYVATRGSSGWQTKYVGIPADQHNIVGGPPNGINRISPDSIVGDLRMERFLDWNQGEVSYNHAPFGSMAPYMWSADGGALGRLPTNLAEIPGGEADLDEGGFIGDLRASADFSHYFFSSANLAFTTDGRVGSGGSVYDNDLATGAVTKVSVLNDGTDIPREPGDLSNDYFTIPAASTDGSHVLISAGATGVCGQAICPIPGSCPETGCDPNREICPSGTRTVGTCPQGLPGHLYMRVDDAVTYDVSDGHAVTFAGMTDDGSKAYFTSAEHLTSDDHDQGVDLYMWSEAGGGTLKRISAGAGSVGDTDSCNAGWIQRCSIEVVSSKGGASGFNGPTDNALAGASGDIYFYSPEQFVASKGIPGRRNLYVYRGGELEYVATLDADKPFTRFQVTSDGAHAAFITSSRLTTYDSAGVAEMYRFDADTDDLLCVSCLPSGDPPSVPVVGSQDGRFIADDGRTFFATREAVLPVDTNGITDVYEYVDGRPRLISSGTGNVDQSVFFGEAGLVGVSADGVDVYFATFERLVEGDHNGQFLRFYDARSGGGFLTPAAVAPCAAADECHAATASPTDVTIGSGAALGDGGNHHSAKAKRKHRHHKGHGGRGHHHRPVRGGHR